MFVNISELKKITNEVKNKKNEELEKTRLIEQTKIEERTKLILDAIPELCYNAAKSGKEEVIVMNLIPTEDYYVGYPFNQLNSHELNKCAKNVFNSCVLKNLKPSIRYCDSFNYEGFNIVVSWKQLNN